MNHVGKAFWLCNCGRSSGKTYSLIYLFIFYFLFFIFWGGVRGEESGEEECNIIIIQDIRDDSTHKSTQ